jgi:hypothetical protein
VQLGHRVRRTRVTRMGKGVRRGGGGGGHAAYRHHQAGRRVIGQYSRGCRRRGADCHTGGLHDARLPGTSGIQGNLHHPRVVSSEGNPKHGAAGQGSAPGGHRRHHRQAVHRELEGGGHRHPVTPVERYLEIGGANHHASAWEGGDVQRALRGGGRGSKRISNKGQTV